MRFRIGTALLLLAVALPACSGAKSRKPVFPVKGQVLDANNKPAVGATVVFHPVKEDPADPTKPVAQVDETGTFTLTTYAQGDGAPEGEYTVTITWPPPKKTPFEAVGADRLNGQYASPAQSKIHFAVEKKPQNEVPPIKVTVS